jgi:hypothetical protein
MRPLLRDERGAIMVMALFMAVFATGCLSYLVALGEAIAQRERMQDAADATAFSAAVLHARGMNVIALVNMTMAALLAVLIALKLVELIAYLGVAVAIGLAFSTAGTSLTFVAPLTTVAIDAREVHDEAQPVVQTSLRALHIAARGVRIVMPWMAQARTFQIVADHYNPPARFGFAVPASITLPTRDGTYDDLCKKSGEYVGDLVEAEPTLQIPILPISELTTALVDSGSLWFCETDGGQPPGQTVDRKVEHPVLPKARACEDYASHESPDRDEHTRLCDEAVREHDAATAAVDPVTGECVRGPDNDCGLDSVYEQRAALAQQVCAPRPGHTRIGSFTWQAHIFKRRYVVVEGKWVVETVIIPGSERYELIEEWPALCRADWNTVRWRDGLLVPICDNVVDPTDPQAWADGVAEVEHTEVLQVFGCIERFRERRELDSGGGELSTNGDGNEMSPQLIAAGAALGEEPFQIRAAVIGRSSRASPDVMLSTLWSPAAEANADSTEVRSQATQLGLISVAQAEFYFDKANPRPSSMLWSMGWTARLRRFRWTDEQPTERSDDDRVDATLHDAGEVQGTFEAACRIFGHGDFPCETLDLSAISEVISH